jgi:MFS transporter, FSR family, fosmidomycin resistance protein
VLAWLAIEFVDELVFGVQGAALPLIRGDLHLGYVAIGLLLSVPALVANFVELPIGLAADAPRRLRLVLGGGMVFALALVGIAVAPGFAALIVALAILYPASGAFVSLSQADLMDVQPDRREQNMARWTLSGSLGALAGPALLAGAALVGAGWRGAYTALAVLAMVALIGRALAGGTGHIHEQAATSAVAAVRGAMRSLVRLDVLRALALLEISDLMLDVLTGYLALYFVDVVGEPPWVGALAVGVRILAGLAGDFVSVHVLDRVPGYVYVRVTALVTLIAFPAFLIVPGTGAKLAAIALVGVMTAGWYPVLQAGLYRELPGQSGAQLAIGNVFRIFSSPIPLLIGFGAARFGLGTALWLIAVSPLLLIAWLPRRAAPLDPGA